MFAVFMNECEPCIYAIQGLFVLNKKGGYEVESRIALIGIIVEDINASAAVNSILHDYSTYIIGRMGVPYKEKNVSVISVVIDAENNVISSLSGKLGMVHGITVKTMYAKSQK